MSDHEPASVSIPLRGFVMVLRKQPLNALEIAWWWITGRRLRARNRFGVVAARLTNHYQIWLSMHQPASTSVRKTQIALLAVHVHVGEGQTYMATTAIGSALDQLDSRDVLYVSSNVPLFADAFAGLARDPRVHILADPYDGRAEALKNVLDLTKAAFLVPLDVDAELTPGALEHYAQAILKHPDRNIVLYADQDERDDRGERSNPWLKPEWDEDLFLAQDYLSAACVLPVRTARRVDIDPRWADDVTVYGLLTKLLCGPDAIAPRHVRWVAVTTTVQSWCRPSASRRDLVHAITRMPVSAGPFATLVLHHPLPEPPPRVSVIVPTRDRIDLLETCIRGVLDVTRYPDIELIIADNDSIEPQTLSYLDAITRDSRVKVIRWPHSYNYSAINNFAVTHATGRYLCLLNNDTEVIDPLWLRTMIAHAVRPEVGAVGARLLYPDRSIQHAGVVIGMGGAAGHAHRGLPDGAAGWFAHGLVTRGTTAVTAACLVVATEKFRAVGGFDQENLAIAYNDIDLCLKLQAAGWHNIYAAQATLIHHESKSRGLDFAPEHSVRYMRELAVFRDRWNTLEFRDPTHHPDLALESETYRLKM